MINFYFSLLEKKNIFHDNAINYYCYYYCYCVQILFLIFISILANKAPKGKEKQARQYGLLLGMVVRIIMLLGINWIQKQEHPLFTIVDHPISGKDILLILGGLFLLYQSVHEIHLKMKGLEEEIKERTDAKGWTAILFKMDLIFSVYVS